MENTTEHRNELAKDCQDYIDYIAVDRIVNDGHHALYHLWKKYGRDVVQAKIAELHKAAKG
jgi:hypothetical protein